MKWLLADWDELSPGEHALLSDALTGGRSDALWLAATVLTRSAPPAPLVKQLTGDAQLLGGTTETIEAVLGPELFAACIRMFRGDPQPLWWYATHHSDNPDWPRIVRALAASPDHPLFGEAFVEIAAFGDKGELLALVDALPAAALMQAFELLLQYKLGCTGFWRDKSWMRLLERAEDAGLLDAMFERIDAVSDGVLEGLRDVQLWLGKGSYGDRLLELYPRDTTTLVDIYNMEKVCNRLLEPEGDEAAADPDKIAFIMRVVITNLVEKLEAEPCRLFETWDVLRMALRRNGGDAELDARITVGRMAAVERHQALRGSARDVVAGIHLDGWVHQGANGRS